MQDHLNKFIDTMSAAGCAPASASDITDGVENKLIKAADDRGKSKSLYVTFRTEGDGKAFGKWYSCKHSNGDTWFSKSSKEWTKEEKKAWQERRDAERAARRKELEEGYEEVALAAQELWRGAKKVVEHPYLKKKGVSGAGCRIHDGDLLIPLRDIHGKLWLLQTITAEGDKFNSFRLPDGKWASGGKKQGCYHGVVSGKTDKGVIVVCEGFATGRSIAEATGLAVVVALDAGNLKPVAEAMRKKYPDADIIIGADNDQWTPKTPRHKNIPEDYKAIPGDDERWAEWRDADLLSNAGAEKGGQAAAAVEGYVCLPDISPDDHAKRTDFNDLHLSEGSDAVSLLFGKIVEKAKESRERAPEPEPPPSTELVPVEAYDVETRLPDNGQDVGDLGLPLKVLGYNEGKYYFFPYDMQQIISYTRKEFSMAGLLDLCDYETWRERMLSNPTDSISDSKMALLIQDMLMKACKKKGQFNDKKLVRGAGAWRDAGRIIVHCGDEVYVDGVPMKPKDVDSGYVYVSSLKVMDVGDEVLDDEAAKKLVEICAMPKWRSPLSGVLLAGWLVVAPICGALDWRPHIWITGEAACGKSTILKEIIKNILSGISIDYDSISSQAAIREEMGYAARPVVFDEADNSSSGKNSSIDDIIFLARSASSGGPIGKSGQKKIEFRSCFCFSAVNSSVYTLQDESRISFLTLNKPHGIDDGANFRKFNSLVASTFKDGYSKKLLARTIDNMRPLLDTIGVLREVAYEKMDDARAADQISTMLGGYWLLHTTEVIPKEKAEELISEYSWVDHTTVTAKSDPERLLQYIAMSIVRISAVDYSMAQLLMCAMGKDDAMSSHHAKNHLRNYSIRVSDDGVDFGASNKNMTTLLRGSEWERGYKKMLLNLPGAEDKSLVYFGAMDKQRAVRVPLSYFIDEGDANEPAPLQDENYEIPF